jgi:integrase
MRDEELKLRGKGVITSHSLRRYFITRFVKETGRRDLVRQIVGHTSTRMTDYYMGDLIETDTLTTIDIGV